MPRVNRRIQPDLADTPAAMTAHVARCLATTHGVADDGNVLCRSGGLHDVGEIIRVRVPVVALPWFGLTGRTAAIVADNAMPVSASFIAVCRSCPH